MLERLHPGNPAHNVFFGLRLTGPLEADTLKRAWSEAVRQHEILRTSSGSTMVYREPFSSAPCSAQFNTRGLEGVSRQEREPT